MIKVINDSELKDKLLNFQIEKNEKN